MPINPSDTITYKALSDDVLAWIKSKIQNMGSYTSAVHASLKSTWINQVLPNTDRIYKWEYRKDFNGSKVATKADRYTTRVRLIGNVDTSSVVSVVTESKINSDWDAFLSNAKIKDNLNKIVNTTGLLNFWDNLVVFLYKHLVEVTGDFAPNGVLMYWAESDKSYKYVTKLNTSIYNMSETCISAQDMLDMIETLGDTYNFPHRNHVVTFSITKDATITKTATDVAPYAEGYDCPEGGPSGW